MSHFQNSGAGGYPVVNCANPHAIMVGLRESFCHNNLEDGMT